jgi:dTDP-glucose 4,6-dehydratase
MALVVTGGAGFIGCNLTRHLLAHTTDRLIIVDKLAYAGSLLNLEGVRNSPRVRFIRADIADEAAMRELFEVERPRAVLNLAAETHVDRSIDNARAFVVTNVVGTYVLLEAARRYWAGIDRATPDAFRFVHVSTDEVFGALGQSGSFSEESPYAPHSPYAASKASADHLVRAYFHTYGLPVILTNCSNNYGPYQYPEKLIPLMILNALEGRPLPIYGDGGHVRDWLHVEDHCSGLALVLDKGRAGQSYNIGGNNERTNLQVVDAICDALESCAPAAGNPAVAAAGGYRALRTFVEDRPGHDRRYAIDASKIRRELGWSPGRAFDTGLAETVRWYVSHREWCTSVQAGRYDRERLGVIQPSH